MRHTATAIIPAAAAVAAATATAVVMATAAATTTITIITFMEKGIEQISFFTWMMLLLPLCYSKWQIIRVALNAHNFLTDFFLLPVLFYSLLVLLNLHFALAVSFIR